MTARHLFTLAAILVLTCVIYSRVTLGNYCGFDDFLDLHRMEFRDTHSVADDLRTAFYNSYKYRPFFFTLNRLVYKLGHKAALAFRVRNLLGHLLTVAGIYIFAMQLFRLQAVAAAAALLFALHPLANQPVVGAVWTMTPADAGLLLSLVLLAAALQAIRFRLTLVVVAIVIATTSILVYDPVIVVFGMMYLYLGARLVLKGLRSVDRRLLVVFVAVTILFTAVWLGLRARYMPPGNAGMVALPLMTINLLVYTVGPLQIIDSVLAAEYLGTPLPPEVLRGAMTLPWLLVTGLPAFCLLLLLLWRMPRVSQSLRYEDRVYLVFLLLCFAGSLAPFLAYNGHASESYSYVGLFMLSPIFGRVLYGACTRKDGGFHRTAFGATVAALALVFACGTWVRNNRVRACSDTVTNILAGLPASKLAYGPDQILLANVAGEPGTRPFGMYGYRGIDTLGIGEYGAPAVQDGLQWAFRNPYLTAEVVSPKQLRMRCGAASRERDCFWVHADGRISPVP